MSDSLFSSRNMQEFYQFWCKILLCCLAGAGLGILFSASAAEQYVSLMRMAPGRPVSIVSSAVAVFLPFLISAFLIVHSKPWLVYTICATCICSTTASGWALYHAYGSAAWLVRLLMQLPHYYAICGILFLSIKRFMRTLRWRTIVYVAVVLAVLGMIDYYVCSPFLAELIDFYETLGRYTPHVGLDWRL